MNLVNPIFFGSNRVECEHPGGTLLEEFLGEDSAQDGPLCEEWLASDQSPWQDAADAEESLEGLSRILEEDGGEGITLRDMLATNAESLLGADHVALHGQSLGFTARLIDTSVRLPITCRPDGIRARKLWNTPQEGADLWHVVETRKGADEPPLLWAGFRENVTDAMWNQAVQAGESGKMLAMMHEVPLHKGETYFFPAGMPHALGGGALYLHVRNPRDLAVRPELTYLGRQVPDTVRFAGKRADQIKDVFWRDGQSFEELDRRINLTETVLRRSDEGYYSELVGADRTDSFSVWRVEVVGRMQLSIPRPFALAVCLAGEGRIAWAAGSRELKEGEYFLQPFGVPWIEYTAFGRLSLMLVLPPSLQE
jgi:mannose-6-phosphate isomerase